jgi:thioredoxin-related protein
LRKLWRKKIMQFIVTNLEEIYTLFFLFFNKKGKMITTIPGSIKEV